jgi:hypothetical protein
MEHSYSWDGEQKNIEMTDILANSSVPAGTALEVGDTVRLKSGGAFHDGHLDY